MIAASLSDLFKLDDNDKRKRHSIVWSTIYQVAFKRLKNAITTISMPMQSDSMKSYIIEMNSSNFGNEMILYQENDDDKLYSVAFDEYKLHEIELWYFTHEKELLTIKDVF